MKAADYLAAVQVRLIQSPLVRAWAILREEEQGDSGLYRYRLECVDGSSLELFERFEVLENQCQVTKYSFHWQNADQTLRYRWDNAPHYPDLVTHPHHRHCGPTDIVEPHEAMDVFAVLAFVENQFSA